LTIDGKVRTRSSQTSRDLIRVSRSVAVEDRALKNRNVPSVEEVTVPSETSRVAVAPDEWPRVALRNPLTGEVGDIPGNLKEQVNQVDGMISIACAIIETRQI